VQRRWMWVVGSIAGLIVLIVTLSFFIEEPLRRYAERRLNSRLQGYTVRISKLDWYPFSLSVDVHAVTMTQNTHPEPPLVHVPRLHARVQWRALLSGRVVADVLVERPEHHLNLQQPRRAAAGDDRAPGRGLQEALRAIEPLKIDEFKVVDADVTYVDKGASRPLHVHQLNLRVGNVSATRSTDQSYPSPIHLEAKVFDAGTVRVDGRADLLDDPHVRVKAQLALEHVELGNLQPILSRYNIALRSGMLSSVGDVEYAPDTKVVHLRTVTLQGLHLDYMQTARAAATKKQEVKKSAQTAEAIDHPSILLRADQVSIVKSHLGFVNKATSPDYRLFLAGAEIHLSNFSNRLTQGTAVAKVTGQFMGSGRTVVGATFRPEAKGPDFALAASIENTQMRALNQLLRAYGDFDVVQGFFSVYTELRVQDGAVRGYVKPLIRELDVYDPRQDKEEGLFQKLYEGLVGGIGGLLENTPRQEVATEADISGRLENPQASTWQVLVNLIQDAFFKAILPGFERESGRATR
jgi:hypothetical protein